MRIASLVAALCTMSGVAVAEPEDALVNQLGDAVSTGDAWNESVQRFAKLVGAPAIATADHIEWAVDHKTFCIQADLERDGLFVKRAEVNSMASDGGEYAVCKKLAAKHAKLPKLPAMPKVDVDRPAQAIMALWKDGKYQAIMDGAESGLRKVIGSPDALARIAALYTPVTGKFVKLGTPLQHSIHHFGWIVTAPAVFEKATIPVELRFELEDGTPKLAGFEFKLPKEMLAKRVPKEAEQVAHHALELLLADKLDDFIQLAHPRLVHQLGPKADFEQQLAALLQKMGKVKKIAWTDIHDCGESPPVDADQCITYAIDTANGTSKATAHMIMVISKWQLIEFNVDPPTK